jgi:hypothetical protein
MRIRGLVVMAAQAAGLLLAVSTGAACTHAGGSLMVDAPKLLPYEAPDIDEITGIETPDAPAEPPAAGNGSAQNPQQAPHK